MKEDHIEVQGNGQIGMEFERRKTENLLHAQLAQITQLTQRYGTFLLLLQRTSVRQGFFLITCARQKKEQKLLRCE